MIRIAFLVTLISCLIAEDARPIIPVYWPTSTSLIYTSSKICSKTELIFAAKTDTALSKSECDIIENSTSTELYTHFQYSYFLHDGRILLSIDSFSLNDATLPNGEIIKVKSGTITGYHKVDGKWQDHMVANYD